LQGDLHNVGVLALTLALISTDDIKFRRDRRVVRALLHIPEEDPKPEAPEEEELFSIEEFRRSMAELKARTSTEPVEAEWE
jgi:hypothetical protein